jgi:RNA polymerase sigma-70 factor, ECF subfamily
MPEDLAEVYRTTYRALVRFLYRKVWDAERAEDLAQEAFVRALEHRPEKARAFVFVVAANLARDEARKEIRQRGHLKLLHGEQGAESREQEQPDEELERKEHEARVQKALGSLSPRDREALLLWDAGSSYDQIAEQLGLAKGAVGTTLARARKRLVEAFDARSEAHDAAL